MLFGNDLRSKFLPRSEGLNVEVNKSSPSLQPNQEIRSYMRERRRFLHRFPEVGLELPNTHVHIAQELQQLGLDVEHRSSAGVSARIPGSDPTARPLILRADMDALPVKEETGEPFSSEIVGASHACGHDLHMATMLGLAGDLVDNPPLRDVIVVFQPGEETDRGAVPTLEHRNLRISEADTYAVHVNSALPLGTVNYRFGTFMAYGDWFSIDIKGVGGHASAPERVGSPIRLGTHFLAEMINVAKALSRKGEKAVATVTEFQSGNTVNVIPATARLRGTIRATNDAVRTELISGLQEIIELDHRDMQAHLEIMQGYPAVIADDQALQDLISVLEEGNLAESLVRMPEPSMVIEDYSYFLQKWPGAMVYVGAQAEANPSFNHSADARFHEEAMDTAFTVFRTIVDAAPRARTG